MAKEATARGSLLIKLVRLQYFLSKPGNFVKLLQRKMHSN